MRVKIVKIGIKNIKEGPQNFVKTCKAIERGENSESWDIILNLDYNQLKRY